MKWTVADVCSWLKSQSLNDLESIFKDQEIDGEVLLTSSPEEWSSLIPAFGKR